MVCLDDSLSRLSETPRAADLNDVDAMVIVCVAETLNKPSNVADYGLCLQLSSPMGGVWQRQIYFPNWGTNVCTRSRSGNAWSEWVTFSPL